jgi:hypothetical protein
VLSMALERKLYECCKSIIGLGQELLRASISTVFFGLHTVSFRKIYGRRRRKYFPCIILT